MVVKFTVALLLAVSVLSVSLGVKEDTVHGTPIRHGKQDHYKDDGSHNVLFDLEALLGSHKLAEEFEELEPEESKRRLSMLAKKMDKDGDSYVSREELIDWILMSFKLLDEEEALEELEELDKDGDSQLKWQEYLESHFSYTQDELKDMRKEDSEDNEELLKQVDDEERKFIAADLNKDGILDKAEFNTFYHPYSYEHMHQFELERTMQEHDKNGDRALTLQEFLANAGDDKEWVAVEKDRFKEYDTNKDGKLSMEEIRPWVLTDNQEEAEEEADHLIEEADTDEDGKLSEEEIIDQHDIFVGSQATDYARYLHFVKYRDEL